MKSPDASVTTVSIWPKEAIEKEKEEDKGDVPKKIIWRKLRNLTEGEIQERKKTWNKSRAKRSWERKKQYVTELEAQNHELQWQIQVLKMEAQRSRM